MSVLAELYDKAQVLPPGEREQLAMMLLDSLPGDEETPIVLAPEDEAEIHRRLEAFRSGRAKTYDLASVMKTLRDTIAQHNKS